MKLTVEQLENREVLTISFINGTLLVVGTDGPDTVSLWHPDENVALTTVFHDGTTPDGNVFHESLVIPTTILGEGRIEIHLLGGNDLYVTSIETTPNEYVYGGEGNDFLLGGHGGGLLDGGNGNDFMVASNHIGSKTLAGGDGFDIAICCPGKDRVMGLQTEVVIGFKEPEDCLFPF